MRRSYASRPVIADPVRTTRAHTVRSQAVFANMEFNRNMANLDHMLYESGTFEGKFHDPMANKRENSSQGFEKARVPLGMTRGQEHSWLMKGKEMNEAEQLAAHILYSILREMSEQHSTLPALFKFVSYRGPHGAMMLEDFTEGLVRAHVLSDVDDISHKAMLNAMSVIDPQFDGCVYFPALKEAIRAVEEFERGKDSSPTSAKLTGRSRHVAQYSDSLPVDIVKVDKKPKSLFDYQKQAEKFRSQQMELLARHGEVAC